MNAPYHPPAGISPRASLPAACPPNPGRRDPIDPRDLARATELVDSLDADAAWMAMHRETLIAREVRFARFEREQKEFRRRHYLGRGKINRRDAL